MKEVQRAVLDGQADIAVHSAKDLPSVAGRRACSWPRSASAATPATRWSVRRSPTCPRAPRWPPVRCVAGRSCTAVRPDLQFVELRGNIHTRLSKLPDGGALVMAVAALQILELTDRIAEALPVDTFVPAPGQGCVAVECRADDDDGRGAARRGRPPGHPRRGRSWSGRSWPSWARAARCPVAAHAVERPAHRLPRRPVQRLATSPKSVTLHGVRRRAAAAGGRRWPASCRPSWAEADDRSGALAGRRVVVTRAAEQADELAALLRGCGRRCRWWCRWSRSSTEPAGAAGLAALAPDRRSTGWWSPRPNGAAHYVAAHAAAPAAGGRGRAPPRLRRCRGGPVASTLVPAEQRAAGLLAEFPPGTGRGAAGAGGRRRADAGRRSRRAGLAGHRRSAPIAACRRARRPASNWPRWRPTRCCSPAVRRRGRGWRCSATTTPPLVVAIGPQTAAAAEQWASRLSLVAADHSLQGLVAALERHLARNASRISDSSHDTGGSSHNTTMHSTSSARRWLLLGGAAAVLTAVGVTQVAAGRTRAAGSPRCRAGCRSRASSSQTPSVSADGRFVVYAGRTHRAGDDAHAAPCSSDRADGSVDRAHRASRRHPPRRLGVAGHQRRRLQRRRHHRAGLRPVPRRRRRRPLGRLHACCCRSAGASWATGSWCPPRVAPGFESSAGDNVSPLYPPAISGEGAVVAYTHQFSLAAPDLTGITVVDLTVPIGEPGRADPVAGTPAAAPDSTFRYVGLREPCSATTATCWPSPPTPTRRSPLAEWGTGAAARRLRHLARLRVGPHQPRPQHQRPPHLRRARRRVRRCRQPGRVGRRRVRGVRVHRHQPRARRHAAGRATRRACRRCTCSTAPTARWSWPAASRRRSRRQPPRRRQPRRHASRR